MARSPYEVLGIREGADFETAKKAYRELVRKYHPDQYVNHPLSDLAEEKLKEINHAYDELSNKEAAKNQQAQQSQQSQYNTSNSGGSSYQGQRSGRTNYQNTGFKNPGPDFSTIRQLIFSNRVQEADAALNNINDHSAEWYYLKGLVFSRMGWYNEAMNSFDTAVRIEPNNFEYRQALNQMNNNNRNYKNTGYNMRGYNSGSNDMCQMCQCLICTDCCCECAGGDFIDCF